MHSWRVLILPYLEQESLYKAYSFDEPWDGPKNRELAGRIDDVFRCARSNSRGSLMTNYVVVVGDHTAFPGSKSVTMKDIPDGRDVILVAEIADSDIHWMEPRDLRFDAMSFHINDKTKPCISSPHRGVANVVLLDFRVETVPESISPELVKALVTVGNRDEIRVAEPRPR